MQVQFTRKCNGYNSGEVADFNEAEAKRYVAMGYALPFGVVAEAEESESPKQSPVNRKMKARVTK